MTRRKFYGSSYELLLEKQSVISKNLSESLSNHSDIQITNRIKSARSMAEKLRKKNLSVNEKEALNGVNDALGFRIICKDNDTVYQIADIIMNQNDFINVQIKDYIERPKKNGYRSLHLIMEMQDGFCFEIQIRTRKNHRLAKIEHLLIYKNPIRRWFYRRHY